MKKIKLQTKTGKDIIIIKEVTDPIAMRLSIGGRPEMGYYITFRGDDMDQLEDLLTEALEAFQEAKIKYNEQMN